MVNYGKNCQKRGLSRLCVLCRFQGLCSDNTYTNSERKAINQGKLDYISNMYLPKTWKLGEKEIDLSTVAESQAFGVSRIPALHYHPCMYLLDY